jgi:CelD/BcsL family acetyltransferase involved in cellulose biosynthesis
MSAAIEVAELSAQDYPAWEQFVAAAPGGSVYALPSYLEVLGSVTNGQVRVIAARRGGEILGGIALYEQQSPAGVYVAPRLLLYYNGLVLGEPRSRYPSQNTSLYLKVVAALDDWLAEQDYASVTLKSRGDVTDVRPFEARHWKVGTAYTYEVACSDPEAAFGRMESNYRRLVNRCDRDGISLVSDDDFDTFFRLHREVSERKGAPLYLPRADFRTYFERLRERDLCRLYHARLPDGTAAASQLVLLGPHPVTHTVAAGASAEHLRSGAAVFLRWKAIEALARDGYLGNDLTDAALNDVTRFKSQLGGDLRLSFVLSRPSSTRWRLREAARRGIGFARRTAGDAARRMGHDKT